MNTQADKWRRVTIECGENQVTTAGSLKTEGPESDGLASGIAFCLSCVLRQLDVSEVEVAAHLLSDAHARNVNEETLAQAGGRFLHRRAGAGV